MSNIIRICSSCWKKYPILKPALQSGALMGAGDAISQTIVEKNYSNYNFKRTARMTMIGTLYIGPVLSKWFGFLDKTIKKSGSSTAVALKKMGIDQFIWAPVFLASILSVIGIANGGKPKEVMNTLVIDYPNVLLTNWMIWPAVQTMNFLFVPVKNQVLVVQLVAVLWNTYISFKTCSEESIQKKVNN